MEWILIVLVIPGKPSARALLSGRHSLLVTSHPILACGWSLEPRLGPDGRDSRDSRARAHEARLGRAQPRLLDTGMALLWLDKRAPPKGALKGQLDLNPSHPSQPSSAGLWLPLLELRLRQWSALAWAFISGQLYARFTP